ncbi:MAG TPA: hypothetical protein VFB13_05410 [Reyranella sp.]|nr:hypothetical protein [Reyranella sp.]
MLNVIARRTRRFLADQRGTVFVEYSSLVLLVAIAAIALLGHVGGSASN